jgi:hypothetical protein
VIRMLVLCLACVAMNARPLFSQPSTQPPVGGCVPTAPETRLDVVGAMAGRRPVWLVDGSNGHWDKRLVKTLLVLSRDVAGSLRIEGRRLDGPGLVAFQDGLDGEPTNALLIPNPWQRTVTPGGASPEVMRSYAFIPTYLIYPSAGCWELTARLDATEVRIVLEVK